MGNKMSAVIHPDDLAVMTDILTEQLQNGNTIHNENRLICKDGTIRWISIQAQLLGEGDGQEFFCVFIDITEEKKLQERNRELYEQELAYFAELSSYEGTIQGTINVTQNRLESYVSTADVAIAKEMCIRDSLTAARSYSVSLLRTPRDPPLNSRMIPH